MQSANILPIGHAPTLQVRVKNRCEQFAQEEISAWMRALLDNVDKALTALSNRTDSTALKTLCFDAMREMRIQRSTVQKKFIDGLHTQLKRDNVLPTLMTTLPNDDEVKLRLALDTLARQINSSANAARTRLRARFHALAGQNTDPSWPVTPAQLGELFLSAIAPVNTDLRIKLTLLKLFDSHVLSPLPELYSRLEKVIVSETPKLVSQSATAGSSLPTAVLPLLNHLQTSNPGIPSGTRWSDWLHAQLPAQLSGHDTLRRVSSLIEELFISISQQGELPHPLSSLINQLRIPLLKVALLDKTFLTQNNHPARKLISALLQLAPAVAEQSEAAHCLLGKMQDVVARISREFAGNIGLFDSVLTEFNAFLEKEQTSNLQQQHHHIRQAQVNDEIELAQALVEQELAIRSAGRRLVPEIQSLLQNSWNRVLIAIYLEEGMGSPRWEMAMEITDELLNSVDEKIDLEQRQQLVAALPGIIAALREDLTSIRWEEIHIEGMFEQLASMIGADLMPSSHNSPSCKSSQEWIFRADTGEWELASTAGPASAASQENDDPIASILASASVTSDWTFDLERGKWRQQNVTTRTETASLSPPAKTVKATQPAPSDNTETPPQATLKDEFTDRALQLKVGEWIELRNTSNELLRARLAWKSEIAGRMIFVNWRQQVVAEPSVAGLAVQLRRGTARLLSQAPIVDKAFYSVMQLLAGDAVADLPR